MRCEYGKMPPLGGCSPNEECLEEATWRLFKAKGYSGKYASRRKPIWHVCDKHRNIARRQYSTAYFTNEGRLL